jgi:2-methylcitrate dehydratase PrpD
MTAISENYARFFGKLTLEQLPSAVVERAKDVILDTLGAGIAGSRSPWVKSASEFAMEQNANNEAILWGTGKRTSCVYAALVNGTAAHAYDYDETHNGCTIHAAGVLLPGLLALAERDRLSGKSLITAFVAGYEFMCRVGMAAGPHNIYSLHLHPTGVIGPLGAAFGTGLLLGLSEKELAWSVGIAGSMPVGLLETLVDGSWTKRINVGLAAHNGLTAALLAAKGFTGPLRVIEGRRGVLQAYAKEHGEPELLLPLGIDYQILNSQIKLYACNSGHHASIESLMTILRQNSISTEEIETIELGLRPSSLGSSYLESYPRNNLQAQMSPAYVMAVSAIFGQVTLSEFTEEILNDARVRELANKVKIESKPEFTRTPEDRFRMPCQVRVTTRSGEVFTHGIMYPKDGPGNRCPTEELIEKFKQLTVPILGSRRTEEILHLLKHLEQTDDLRKLIDGIGGSD